MGFFTPLNNLWSQDWGFGKSKDLLGNARDNLTTGVKSVAGGLWNLAKSPWGGDGAIAQAFVNASNAFNVQLPTGLVNAGLNTLSAVGELPLAKQLLGTAGFVQNEVIKRPLGTASLVAGDALRGRTGLGALAPFSAEDRDVWRRAYDDTRTVSTGQAVTYASTGFSPSHDYMGLYDPRTAQGQDLYHNDTFAKYASGSVDAALDTFADPTMYAGKATSLLKLRFLSPALKTAAQVDKYVNTSDRYMKLREFVKNADSSEAVRQRAFNNHVGGDKAAAVLWSVREDDELYDLTFRSLYGDPAAWGELTKQAPRIAEITGRMYANETMAKAANAAGQSSKADDILNALGDTETDGFVDAVANGQDVGNQLATNATKDFADAIKNDQGAWGKSHGVLRGTSAPYLSMTSAWRTGIHNWVTFGPQAFRGAAIYPVFSRARYAMPSAKFTRFLDVVDNNSVGAFRSNLERAPFTRPELEKWVSAYGRATSPEARARIAAAAEDDGFRIMASKYGWSPAQVANAITEINKFRSANRAVFNNSRRFFSDSVRRLAEKYIAEGRTADSDRVYFLGQDMEDAIRRGDQPESVHVLLDEDGNNVFVPGRFRVDPSEPAMLSQRADILPMVDWRVADTALWWAKHGPVGEHAYKAVNYGLALMDTVNTVWKLTALLRPGYVWRMLSDDVMRRISLYGASKVLMSTGPGIKNAALNWAAKGALGRDWALRQRRRYGLEDVHTIDGEVVDGIDHTTEIARPKVGGAYAPSPRAVEMSAAPDTLLRFALEAISGKKGYLTKADFRKSHNIGDQTANRLIDELRAKGFIEHAGTKGRVNYYTSKVSKYDIGLMRKPLKYDTYDKALADGVISFDTYLKAIEEHAHRGDLPADLADILSAKRRGELHPRSDKAGLERVYRNNVMNYALRSVNRGAFTQPAWQREFLDEIVARHTEKPQGMPGRRTVIDPFTGALPDLPNGAKGEIESHWFNLSKGKEVDVHPNALYDYIAENVDDLLKPTNVLHAYITPDGKLDLSVARWNGDPAVKIKETGGVRVTFNPWWSREPKGTPRDRRRGPYAPAKKPQTYVGAPRRGSGFNRVRVNLPDGNYLEYKAAFEGSEGQLFRAQASSTGQQNQWVNQVTDTDAARLLNETRGQRDIAPHEGADYRTAWERAVNVQIFNDKVARRFLQGWSDDKILDWMRNDPEGRAYWGRLGMYQARPMEQIYIVKAQVNTYLPEPNEVAARVGGELSRAQRAVDTGGVTKVIGGSEAEGIAQGGEAWQAAVDLRQAALEGRANFDAFKRLFPNEDSMPYVHGATLDIAFGGKTTEWLKRRVNGIFRVMSDMPADSLSRFPFFAQRYSDHLRDMTPLFHEQYAVRGEFMPAEALGRIESMARDRALADVKKYLYDTSASLDLASAAKLLIPFSSAVGDSYLKWGVIAREQGIVAPALRIFKLWTAPDRAGLVQDEEGNVKQWDAKTQQFRWYQVNPKTHDKTELKDHQPKQEYIVFQLPSKVDPRTVQQYQTVKLINKQVFNTFLGLPTAGPLVSYPANEFALKNPKQADNFFIKNFILPFGPTSDDYKALVPANFRSTFGFVSDLYQKANGHEDMTDHRNIAQAVMQTEYTRYALRLRDKAPTMEEVQDRADGLARLQWLTQFFGLSTQFKSPYQPYVDYYHMLQQKADDDRKAGRTAGWETGDGGVEYNALGRFYAEMGDEFMMMTASVTRNVAGLPASVESSQRIKDFQDLIAQHPDLASLIVGSEGAGKFSSAVYQAQLEQTLQPGSNTKMREVLALPDSVADAERRMIWVKYGKMMDAIDADMLNRGLKSLNNYRAKDLKAIRDKFVNDNKYWTDPQGVTTISPWYQEFATSDRATMTKRLTDMAALVADKRLQGRDDMRGLFDYLQTRMEVRAQMKESGFATLDSQGAAPLKAAWEAYVTNLKEKNLSFADLHHRWLDNDNLTYGFLLPGAQSAAEEV